MAKNGTEFSKYAQAFFEIIYGAKSRKAIFVKELLKMGLTVEDKEYINDSFPTMINSKKQRSIEMDKADQLRKYLRGDNDISDIVSNLETEFDEDFRKRYCDELQDYDESRIMEFARVLKINVNEDDIDEVSEAIAEYYSYNVIGSAIQKRTKSHTSIDGSKSVESKSVHSYTISESEKRELLRLCELIKKSLASLKRQTDSIIKEQEDLNKLPSSEEVKRWKIYLESDVNSLKKRFDEGYLELEKLCADAVGFLEPKKGIHKSFGTIITIAQNISSDEYRITSPKFDYSSFAVIISKFNDSYNRLLRDIDKI